MEKDHCRRFFEDFSASQGFDPFVADNWLNVTQAQLLATVMNLMLKVAVVPSNTHFRRTVALYWAVSVVFEPL